MAPVPPRSLFEPGPTESEDDDRGSRPASGSDSRRQRGLVRIPRGSLSMRSLSGLALLLTGCLAAVIGVVVALTVLPISVSFGPSSPAARPSLIPAGSSPTGASLDPNAAPTSGGPVIRGPGVQPTGSGTAAAQPTASSGGSEKADAAPAKKPIKTGLLTGADFPSGRVVSLKSRASGKFVTVAANYQNDYREMLRANAASASALQRFTLVWKGGLSAWALRSKLNGKYISAEIDDPGTRAGMLKARSSEVKGWECFDLYRFADGSYAFESQASGSYVAVESGYGSVGGVDVSQMLRARSGSAGAWERFVLS
jgi:hypothetical protein